MAASNQHYDTVALLLQRGARADLWDWRGRTPLYAVVDLNTLPNQGGRPDLPSLDQTSSLEAIRLLLNAGANPNAQLKLFPDYRHLRNDRGADNVLSIGATSLLRAAKAFDVPAAQLLLAHGAKHDLPTKEGFTPLMLAAGLGSTAIDTRGVFDTPDVQQRAIAMLRVLIAHGADPNATNRRGHSAVFGAVWWGWNDVLRYLVSVGARLDVVDAQGRTLLDAALGKAPDAKKFANVARFYAHLASFTPEARAALPGSIGGALRMNAGAHGGETTDVLIEARGVDRAGVIRSFTHDAMGFSYRHSEAPEDVIFTSALFQGRPGDPAAIMAEMDRITAAREASQPIREKTGGSTFANPKPQSAWKVIDAAGCRGLVMGDAQMSEMHCNFLINRGQASAADIEGLGEEVRRRVLAHSGVELRWEIRRIGVAG
jgi:UDP-N-acetylenolpyruvoylglucosamine reductase